MAGELIPGTPEFTKWQTGLESVESAGDPGAIQRHTKAVGLYQFIPRYWEKFAQAETGRSLTSFLPKDSSPAERERAAKEQREVLFPAYFKKQVAPWIEKTRKAGLGKDMSDTELATLFHKLGDQDSSKYLKTGVDASAGTVDNTGIQEYINQVGRRAGQPIKTSRPPDVISTNRMAPPGGIFSAGPEAALGQNQQILASLKDLNKTIGGLADREAYLNRLRAEGGGITT